MGDPVFKYKAKYPTFLSAPVCPGVYCWFCFLKGVTFPLAYFLLKGTGAYQDQFQTANSKKNVKKFLGSKRSQLRFSPHPHPPTLPPELYNTTLPPVDSLYPIHTVRFDNRLT